MCEMNQTHTPQAPRKRRATPISLTNERTVGRITKGEEDIDINGWMSGKKKYFPISPLTNTVCKKGNFTSKLLVGGTHTPKTGGLVKWNI